MEIYTKRESNARESNVRTDVSSADFDKFRLRRTPKTVDRNANIQRLKQKKITQLKRIEHIEMQRHIEKAQGLLICEAISPIEHNGDPFFSITRQVIQVSNVARLWEVEPVVGNFL